jgi:hypothetical protein
VVVVADAFDEPPAAMRWEGVGVCYKTAAGAKWVLKDASGEAAAGEMQVGGRTWARRRASALLVEAALQSQSMPPWAA